MLTREVPTVALKVGMKYDERFTRRLTANEILKGIFRAHSLRRVASRSALRNSKRKKEKVIRGLTLSFFFLSGVMKPFFAFLALEASSRRARTSALFLSVSACFLFFSCDFSCETPLKHLIWKSLGAPRRRATRIRKVLRGTQTHLTFFSHFPSFLLFQRNFCETYFKTIAIRKFTRIAIFSSAGKR